MPGSELEDFVAHGSDDRDEQHPRPEQYQRRLASDQRKGQDRHDDHHDQEFRATARVGCGVLASRIDGERVAAFQGVDGHVLGTVVLEGAPHVAHSGHQQEVADEDGDADYAFRQLKPEAAPNDRGCRLGKQEREQEENPDTDEQAEQQHSTDRHGVTLAQSLLGGRGRGGGAVWIGVGVGGRTLGIARIAAGSVDRAQSGSGQKRERP